MGVVETGVLQHGRNDPAKCSLTSRAHAHQDGWSPAEGVALPEVTTPLACNGCDPTLETGLAAPSRAEQTRTLEPSSSTPGTAQNNVHIKAPNRQVQNSQQHC